jgi:eukaryotic-like serine/threonine-protein kinase
MARVATCGRCGRVWPAGYLACPGDGTPLELSEDDVQHTVHTVRLQYEAPRPTASRSVIAPGTQIGEYVVERLVTRGGMGAIYAARHPVLGKQAAIKVIHGELTSDPALLERFVREAQAVNLIRHPNIVDVFSIGALPDGRTYFVMDWLDGESLAQRLAREERIPLPEAAWILEETIDAMLLAHAAGIVHRDLKPSNIFLARRGALTQVKVLDFGIAKLSGAPREQTQAGVLMGTPAYLAPEQARTSQVDHRADIYALGVVAFEMLAGQRPFAGTSRDSVVGKHMTAEPPRLSEHAGDLPPPVSAIVAAMMAKDPAARPPLDEVRRVLEPFAARTGAPARMITAPPRPALRRRSLLFGSLAAR